MRIPASLVLASIFVSAIPLKANAQQPNAAAVVERVLQSGNGHAAGTAYAVPGLLWEYVVLDRLNLRLSSQHTAVDTGTDVITARDAKTGRMQDVWFRAAIPDIPEQAETDRVVRAIMTSGDGKSPDTAFVVGGRIGAEYQILRLMGIKSNSQALVTIRGCSFDRLTGRDIDTKETRELYFKLGSSRVDHRGECTLQPLP